MNINIMKLLRYSFQFLVFGYSISDATNLNQSNTTSGHGSNNCSAYSIANPKFKSPAYHIVHISDLGIDFNKLLLKENLTPCVGTEEINTKSTQGKEIVESKRNDSDIVGAIDPKLVATMDTQDLSYLVPNNSIYSPEVWIDHYKREQQRYFAYIQTYHLDADLGDKLKDFEKRVSELLPSNGAMIQKSNTSSIQSKLSGNISTTLKGNACEANSNISLSSRVMEMVQVAIEKATKILQRNENRTVALVWTGGHHPQTEESLIRTLIQSCPDMLKRLDELIVGILKSLTNSLNYIPIVYAIGPYDTFEPFRMPAGPNENLEFLSTLWKDVIPASQVKTFRRGGYYALDILSNDTISDISNDTIRIRIISLNTYYFAKSNDLVCDCDDFGSPGRRQLLWLNNQLVDAAEKGMTTYIVGHLAPSKLYYKPACYAGYVRLLQDFNREPIELPRVTGQFFDRVHCMQTIPPYINRDVLRMEDEYDISNVLLLPRMMKRKKTLRCVKPPIISPTVMVDHTRVIVNNATSQKTNQSNSTVIPSSTSTLATKTMGPSSNTTTITPANTNATIGSSNTTNLATNYTLNMSREYGSENMTFQNSTANTTTNSSNIPTPSFPLVIHTCETNHGENLQERKNIASMMADRRRKSEKPKNPEIVISNLVIPEQKKVQDTIATSHGGNILEDMISDAMKSFFGKDDSDITDDCGKEQPSFAEERRNMYCPAEEERRWYHNFPRSLQEELPSVMVIDDGRISQCNRAEDALSMIQAIARNQIFPMMNNVQVAPRPLLQPVTDSISSRPHQRKRSKTPYRPTIVDKMLCSRKKRTDPLGQCQGSGKSKHSFNLLDMDLDGDW